MNISLTLLKRTGLSQRAVDELTKNLKEEVKNLKSEVDKTKRDIDFWKYQFKRLQPAKKCTKCKGLIDVFPFATESYYLHNNRVTHKKCEG